MKSLSMILRTVIENEPNAISYTLSVAVPYAAFAQRAYALFATALKSVGEGQMLFTATYVHARKMAGLGILSALRQHRVESAQNLRQAIEATSLFGYLAMHPGIPGDWGKENATHEEITKANEQARIKAFKWIAIAYPELSNDLIFYKDHINRNTTHATILNTSFVFDFVNVENADQRFFDVPDAHETRTGLFLAGQVIIGAFLMLGYLSRDAKGIELRPDMQQDYNALMLTGLKLRDDLLAASAAEGFVHP